MLYFALILSGCSGLDLLTVSIDPSASRSGEDGTSADEDTSDDDD